MKKMRIICLLLALVVCFGFVGTGSEVSYADNEISPYYTEVSSISLQLTSFFNIVQSNTQITVANESSSAKISVEIFESADGKNFDSVTKLTGSSTGWYMRIENEYDGKDGYYYKAKVTAKIYDGNGNYIETVTCNSNRIQL